MRRVVLLALLAMALPTVALGNSVSFHLAGGTMSVTPTSASIDATVLGFSLCTSSCGTFHNVAGTASITFPSFNTTVNGTFGAGGSISISDGGYLFTGTFIASPGNTWVVNHVGTKTEFSFTGVASGQLALNGVTIPTTVTFTVGQSLLAKCPGGTCTIGFESGNANVTTVPEPGTLSLLGTGLIGLAGVVRRRFHRAA